MIDSLILLQHSPTNKLLYAKDIPQYKQEVKSYYKMVKDQPSISSQELKLFLQDESKVQFVLQYLAI